ERAVACQYPRAHGNVGVLVAQLAAACQLVHPVAAPGQTESLHPVIERLPAGTVGELQDGASGEFVKPSTTAGQGDRLHDGVDGRPAVAVGEWQRGFGGQLITPAAAGEAERYDGVVDGLPAATVREAQQVAVAVQLVQDRALGIHGERLHAVVDG